MQSPSYAPATISDDVAALFRAVNYPSVPWRNGGELFTVPDQIYKAHAVRAGKKLRRKAANASRRRNRR